MQFTIKVRLKILLQVRFLKPIEIIDCLSNIVLVKKKQGRNKLKMCVYWDLNRYIQKDYFLLPFITSIRDDVVGHDLYSFMDDYSNYK